jgi:hypothetical protein
MMEHGCLSGNWSLENLDRVILKQRIYREAEVLEVYWKSKKEEL